jgi:DNA-binding protein HU-beta
MTKAEYIEAIATKSKISKIQADNVLKSFIDIVNTEDKILVHGLGTFKKVVVPARTGRSPRTGAAIQCPEKTVMRFKESKKAA